MKQSKKPYNNIYFSYEGERQSRADRIESKKIKKSANIRKQLQKREDCLNKAIITKGSELRKTLIKSKLKLKVTTYVKLLRKMAGVFFRAD